MIVDLGHADVPVRAPRAFLCALVAALAAGAIASAAAPAAGRPDIELTRFPDRYANDPFVLALAVPVDVRGTTGIASFEGGATSLLWTEGGVMYRLSSRRANVDDLVRVAALVR